MENLFDLITYLNNWCNENHIYFCAGPEQYNNIVIDNNLYNDYDLLLCVAFNMIPKYSDTGLQAVTYQGSMALGRKREEETESTLDEDFMQKYTNRLVDLTGMLNGVLENLQCTQDAYVDSCTMNYVLNKYDLNVDFVNATVSIRFEK